ncbi:MAG TPA: class I SAM-dependent methyltransferase [Acetobacteraceae bacterium]|nr:class I SAM-dependent methyltransferase [Acetobacteraceae bacterium]
MTLDRKLRRYIRKDMHRIPGWMHPLDASAWAALLLYQRAQDLAGNIAEIGVYYGRSFFLLGQSLADGERAFAADLFESGPLVQGAVRHQMREFLQAGARCHVPCETLPGPSDQLTPDRFAFPVRFFSIDGGHGHDEVTNDVGLATASLAEYGVIAFDDVFNPEYPDTTVAIVDWLRACKGQFVPFAVTDGKLYVCRREWRSRYQNALADSPWTESYTHKPVTLLGQSLVWLHHPIYARIRHHAAVRVRRLLGL